MNPARDAITLYRAANHRRPVVNGYSGYFAPHYWALQYLLERKDPAALTRLTSMGTIEAVVDHNLDADGRWRRYLSSDSQSSIVRRDTDYTAYRIGRSESASASALPQLRGRPIAISTITASLYQDEVARMTDGDRVTRWHTGGPQAATNELTLDLGSVRQIGGVEQALGGYVADFPRSLIIETSVDRASWVAAWSGETAHLALSAALEQPLEIPLRFPFEPRPGRYIRLRQVGSDPIYYWSIAELKVIGE
jgi:hypothetical protein